MRVIIAILCILAFSTPLFAQDAQRQRPPKVLIAFFSLTNNTRTIAEEINRRVGGDMFHITTLTPYPQDNRQTVNLARQERERNLRPQLAATISPETMQQYDIIFLGYPNWWHTMPMAVYTFLEQYDLSGKVIVPFCTHAGSGLSNTVNEIQQIFPRANVLPGLAVSGQMASRAQNDVTNWLRHLRFIR